MNNTVTLGEIFAKAQDSLTPSFNSVQFEADVDNLSKAETENLLGTIQAEIIKGGDYDTLTEMRSIALDHIADIEKAVYADTPQNRKLGRVGQEYGGKGSRGGKTDDGNGGRREMSGKKDKLPDTFRLPVKDSNLTRKVSGVSYTLNHVSYDKQRGTIIVSATHPDGRKSEKTFHYNTDGELKKMQAAVKHYLETDGDRNMKSLNVPSSN